MGKKIKQVTVGKLYDMEVLVNKGLEPDQFVIANPVEIAETYDTKGYLIKAGMIGKDGKPIVPKPRFITEYEERLKNFGQIVTFFPSVDSQTKQDEGDSK